MEPVHCSDNEQQLELCITPIPIDPVLSQSPIATTVSHSVGPGSSSTRRKRVFLKSDEDKARLVRLCINNFGRYGEGKERFFEAIHDLYREIYPDPNGNSPNVKGFMQRWCETRRKELEEACGKSGIAEQASEWQQVMDHWLELIRDFDIRVKEEKTAGTERQAALKKDAKSLRVFMTKSYMNKGHHDAGALSSMETEFQDGREDTEEVDPQVESGSSVTNNAGKKRKREASDPAFASHRRTSDRIIETLREGDEKMMEQMREVEMEKIVRWKEILIGLGSRVQQQHDLTARIERLEEQGSEAKEILGRTTSTLDAILTAVQALSSTSQARVLPPQPEQ
ncbi:hypothetical protein DFP73DRAFT_588810 [Morchella snyderi]|nr:hypothetical protein DFP73DRAFT_588810 [Morchella snyderi]